VAGTGALGRLLGLDPETGLRLALASNALREHQSQG
jgi:hypothetical protein